jgi:UDP-N-acetylglucosamine 1-carboxyvinyltransferase
MDRLVIEGGNFLEGRIRISGAKNAALPAMAATILAESGTFRLSNVPDLVDIKTFSGLLRDLGAEIGVSGSGNERVMTVDASGISSFEAPYDLVRKMRASVLVLGPLVARYGRARVSMPGGCAIGARPILWHTAALEKMGADVRLEHGYVDVVAPGLTGAHIYFDSPTVTGTENVMMAAVLARGRTVIENAAREPEVVDLGMMLNGMGARITGLGSEILSIEGVKRLDAVDWRIIPDRIEAGTYIMAAGAAGGELEIEEAEPSHLDAVIAKLTECGMDIVADQYRKTLHVSHPSDTPLSSADLITRPYPGFPTDLQAQFMALMTFASGLSVIKETIFENRFMHVGELRRLGADIREDGRSAIVEGVEGLKGAPVMATDLRASASLVIAGLAARGTTVVNRVYHLDRGYERMEEKLAAVGAGIMRVGEEWMPDK